MCLAASNTRLRVGTAPWAVSGATLEGSCCVKEVGTHILWYRMLAKRTVWRFLEVAGDLLPRTLRLQRPVANGIFVQLGQPGL